MITFWQIYFAMGIATFLLPFLVERGAPKQWRTYSFPYRVLLTILVLLLWPVPLVAFVIAVYRITRAYFRLRRVARRMVAAALDEIAREEYAKMKIAEIRLKAEAKAKLDDAIFEENQIKAEAAKPKPDDLQRQAAAR